ncbi:MAG: trypsin-like serine protease [Cyanobacteriota bacterium]|nr:trypsin-like serine protease [Cyanobacteriota bacterium]
MQPTHRFSSRFSNKCQKWLRLGVISAGLILASNGLLRVQADTTTGPSGFGSADQRQGIRFTLPAAPTASTLETPIGPEAERGIICLPDQPPAECDDRVPMTDRRQPWSAIGRLVMQTTTGDLSICTGTLIADDLILTNAHCVVDPDTHQPYPAISFQPNLINGTLVDRQDIARVVGGVYGTDFSDRAEPPHPQDWAIAILDKPLGRRYGTIGLQDLSLDVLLNHPGRLTLVGYSFDFPDPAKFRSFQAGKAKTPGMHENCSVTGERNTILLHDCDMRGGASGGPIIGWLGGKPYIVAINSAELANPTTGIGSANYATNVANVVAWLRSQGQ